MTKKSSTNVAPKRATKQTQVQNDYTVLTNVVFDIQQKLNSSAVLNGGFNTLVHKVDKIETAQDQILTSVSEIRKALYEPGGGIVATMSTIKSDVAEDTTDLEKKLLMIDVWKQNTEKAFEDDRKIEEVLLAKSNYQQSIIDDMQRWRSNISSIGKWSAVALGGGAVTLMFKLIYDYVTNHWK